LSMRLARDRARISFLRSFDIDRMVARFGA